MKAKRTLCLIATVLLTLVSVSAQDSIQRINYPSGKLMKEYSYSGGKMNGIAKGYYESGKLMWQTQFLNDNETGIAIDYYEEGQVKVEASFTNGEKNGLEKHYWQNGQLMWETPFIDGVANGMERGYTHKGVLNIESPVANNKVNGIRKEYYKGGQLMNEAPYTNGLKNGIEKEYYDSGNLFRETPFTNGRKNGIRRFYEENGQIYKEIPYLLGKRNDGQEDEVESQLADLTESTIETIKKITIGTQTWSVKNLDVFTFRNGDQIFEAQTNEQWERAGINNTPAWCYYNGDPENGTKYGKIYNWYAVNDSRGLAPKGWHVPSDDEWTTLDNYLGDFEMNGIKMKTMYGWFAEGNGSNTSGFSAMPGGYRNGTGVFFNIRENGGWWSSTEGDNYDAWLYSLYYKTSILSRDLSGRQNGLSVRCIKD